SAFLMHSKPKRDFDTSSTRYGQRSGWGFSLMFETITCEDVHRVSCLTIVAIRLVPEQRHATIAHDPRRANGDALVKLAIDCGRTNPDEPLPIYITVFVGID